MENIHSTEKPAGMIMLRHLKDIDDLRNSRDSSIESGQEEIALKVAESIYSDFESTDSEAIFLSVSSKKRTVETAELLKSKLKDIDRETRVFINPDDDLVDLDHGEYILPDDYQVGDPYPPFERAWEIFIDETFNKDNYDYRFGDSVYDSEESPKYPSLEGCFTRAGESYREICIRLYESILKLYANKERFHHSKIRPYVLTHSLPFGIFRSLIGISEEVKNKGLEIETGTLMKVCWEYYNSGKLGRSSYGQISEVPADLIDNDIFIEVLNREVDFLKKENDKI